MITKYLNIPNIASIFIIIFFSYPAKANAMTYYVSTTGNDSYSTIQAQNTATPWKTIQKCLDSVIASDNCLVTEGIYNEVLTLKISGTSTARITLKNYNNQSVTVNSGNSKTLITGGRIDYYTIDGLRLISNLTPTNQSDVTVDLGTNVPFSETDITKGNNGLIVKNCYIEGAIHFYGHNNMVENCELNGKNIFSNGLIDNFAPSYNNVYRNNNIHNYLVRGVWTMAGTDNILIEGNTVYNSEHGIDCDGAGVPITRCMIINNHVYNLGIYVWGAGIFLEDCFDCQIQGNTIHDIKVGPGIFNINYGNGSAINDNWHTKNNIEYRNQNSNTKITNNLIYNYGPDAGIAIKAVNGLFIDHNTIYHTGISPAIGHTQDNDVNGVYYCPQNEIITNNILYKNGYIWHCSPTVNNTILGNYISNPSFANPPEDLHLNPSSPACTAGENGIYAGAFPCEDMITPTNTPALTIIPTPSCTLAKQGDVNCSGKVNALDLSILLGAFGSTTNTAADLNSSGKVNALDMSILLSNFGRSG